MDFWLSHKWTSARGRSLAIAGKSLRHFKCRHCRRDFVQVSGSGERYAVHVSMFDFERLADRVTDRWLKQPCLHTAPRSDDNDRLTRRAAAPWDTEHRAAHRSRIGDVAAADAAQPLRESGDEM
jgi:hypothetical protein